MGHLPSTILLIDDNEVERSCTALVLYVAGYRTVTARGSEGLDHFWKRPPDLALIKAEPEFPDVMDGHKLAEGIKRLSPETPVILFSIRDCYVRNDTWADRFLAKGSSSYELLETIRIAMIRKRGPKRKPAVSEYQIQQQRLRA